MSASERPRLHPMADDPIESERCPDCGRPGRVVRRLGGGIAEWACPVCDADSFASDEPGTAP